jgi:hypothetical protein
LDQAEELTKADGRATDAHSQPPQDKMLVASEAVYHLAENARW